MRIYLETSFFSYLTGRPTRNELIALRQNTTKIWWEEEAKKHELFISGHVTMFAGIPLLDGFNDEVDCLAKKLLTMHAVPRTEVTDAYHIATAAVHKMDVLLTWNCRHMANRFALPKTISVVQSNGFECPSIVTPDDFMKENLDA